MLYIDAKRAGRVIRHKSSRDYFVDEMPFLTVQDCDKDGRREKGNRREKRKRRRFKKLFTCTVKNFRAVFVDGAEVSAALVFQFLRTAIYDLLICVHFSLCFSERLADGREPMEVIINFRSNHTGVSEVKVLQPTSDPLWKTAMLGITPRRPGPAVLKVSKHARRLFPTLKAKRNFLLACLTDWLNAVCSRSEKRFHGRESRLGLHLILFSFSAYPHELHAVHAVEPRPNDARTRHLAMKARPADRPTHCICRKKGITTFLPSFLLST